MYLFRPSVLSFSRTKLWWICMHKSLLLKVRSPDWFVLHFSHTFLAIQAFWWCASVWISFSISVLCLAMLLLKCLSGGPEGSWVCKHLTICYQVPADISYHYSFRVMFYCFHMCCWFSGFLYAGEKHCFVLLMFHHLHEVRQCHRSLNASYLHSVQVSFY